VAMLHLSRGNNLQGDRSLVMAVTSASISWILRPQLDSTSDLTTAAIATTGSMSIAHSAVFTWHVHRRLHLGALRRSGLDDSGSGPTFHSFIAAMCP
jgi:hypothetical protein